MMDKTLTVTPYRLESRRYKRERETRLSHTETEQRRQPRRRPKHGENKWRRELALSPQHTPPLDLRSASVFSDCSATSSRNVSPELPLPSGSPCQTTPTPQHGHIPKIVVTDTELPPMSPTPLPPTSPLTPIPTPMLNNMKYVRPLSNSLPSLINTGKRRTKKTVFPHKVSPLAPCHSTDSLVKLPKLTTMSNCQMTRTSSCDTPGNRRLPKLARAPTVTTICL